MGRELNMIIKKFDRAVSSISIILLKRIIFYQLKNLTTKISLVMSIVYIHMHCAYFLLYQIFFAAIDSV